MIIDKIALALLIIGGLNWGSVGLFQFDLVAFACGGSASMISRIIYTIVGLWACPPCGASLCCSGICRTRKTDPRTGRNLSVRRAAGISYPSRLILHVIMFKNLLFCSKRPDFTK